MDRREAMQYSPLTLAFMGDSVYEQLVRKKLVLSANRPVNSLHKLTTQRVCAEYQAAAVNMLAERELLSEEEQDILRRGRNASGVSAPKHSTVAEYRSATGLECLLNSMKELMSFLNSSGSLMNTAQATILVYNHQI